MRVINADEYMDRLRANIDSTADNVAKYIKDDEPIGTVKDGGQIGYLLALQWARNTLELDYYTVQAIPIPENATNGDMIKAMFPNCKDWKAKIEDNDGEMHEVHFVQLPNSMTVNKYEESWWNAPYKGGQEE